MKKLLSVFIALLLMIGMVIPAFTVSAEEVNKTSLSDAFSSVDNWTGATNYINTTDKVLFINDGWNTTNASIETIENYDFGSVLNANFGLYYSYPNASYTKNSNEYSIKIGKFEIIIGNYQNKITVTYDGNDIGGTCEILNEVTGNDVTLNYSVHIEPGKISIASESVEYKSTFSNFDPVNNAKVSINQIETWHIDAAKFSNLSIAKQNSNFVADFSDSTLWSGDVTAINTVDKWFGAKSGFNDTTDGYGWNNKPATVTTKLSYYFGKQFDGDFSIFTGYANGSYYDESGLKANKENEDFKIQIGDFIISVCDYQTRIKVTYKGADIPGKSHCSDYNYYTDFKRNYSVHVEKGYILIESENVVYHSDFENFDSVDNAKISLNLNETWQLSSGYITAVSIEGNTAELVVGDCDQDGKLTSLDLVNVRKILLLDLPIKTKFADINRDGFVNILDLVRLKKLLVSLGINDLESSFTSDFTDVEKWKGDTANINTASKYFGTVGTFSNTDSSIIAKDKVNLGNGFVSEFGIRTYYSNDVKPTDDHFDVQIGDFKVVVSAIQNQIQLFYGDTEIGNVSNEEYTYPADPKVYTYELYVVPGFISVTQKSGDNILLTLSSDFSEFSKLYSEEITLSIFETWQIWDAYFTNFSVEAITPNASEFVADFTTTDSWNGDTQFVVADKGFGSTDGWGTTTGTVTSTSKYDFGTKFDGTFTMYTEYSNGDRINSNEDYYIEIGSFKIAICDYQTKIKVYYNGKDIGGTSICSNNTYVTPVTKDYLIHIEPGNISIKSDIVTYTSGFSGFSAVNNVSISLTKNETWQIYSAFIKSLSVSSAQKKNFNIIVNDFVNGNVIANKSTAVAGETITVSISPENGYQLVAGSLKYSFEDTTFPITKQISQNEYSFIMPNQSVTIIAAFEVAGTQSVTTMNIVPNNNDVALSDGIELQARAYNSNANDDYGVIVAEGLENDFTADTEGVLKYSAKNETFSNSDSSVDYIVNIPVSSWYETVTVKPYVLTDNGYVYGEAQTTNLNAAAGFLSNTSVVASDIREVDGKKVVYHNNAPYLMSGVQAQLSRELTKRPDTKAEFERYIEPYFYNAADLSYDTLAISFPWSAFEYAKDKYDYQMVKYIFEYANKYNLNIQILWFGSDVCGSSEFTPAYIRNDVETYSLLGDTSNLDYSDKHLIYREKKAYSELLKALNIYDTEKRTAVIQLENEVNTKGKNDTDVDFSNLESVNANTWVCGQYESLSNLLNELAILSDTGAYQCVTRVNYVAYDCYYAGGVKTDEMSHLIANTAIDMIGIAAYGSGAGSEEMAIVTFDGNIAHIAEASGGTADATLQMLNAAAKTNGLIQYELKFVSGYSSEDLCVLNKDGSYRDGSEGGNITTELIGVNKFFKSVGNKIVTLDSNKKSAFQQTISIPNNYVTYNSEGVGFSANANDGIYLYSTRLATFKLDKEVNYSIGYYQNNEWVTIVNGTGNNIEFTLDYAQNGYCVKIS